MQFDKSIYVTLNLSNLYLTVPIIHVSQPKNMDLRAPAAVELNSYIAILAPPKHKNTCCSNGGIPKFF